MDVIKESRRTLKNLDWGQVNATVRRLDLAERIFCVGNGGGYAHAMHFASDLRKIRQRQAFSFDNVAELTARVNDQSFKWAWDGWRTSFGYKATDVNFIFSVGGALTTEVSENLNLMCPELGIVGASGGFGDRIVIPSTSTPVIEGCQSVIAHHIVEQLVR